MKNIQRAILFIFFTAVLFGQSSVLLAETAAVPPAQPQQKFLFKLTHFVDNLHAAMMAFGMANGVLKQGHQAKILLVMDAVQMANKSQPLAMRWGNKDHDFEHMYKEFLQLGGKIYACPACSGAMGIDQANLRPEIQFAEKGVVPQLLIEADKVIDY